MRSQSSTQNLSLPLGIVLALLSSLGAALVGSATPYGVGLRDDSFTYLTAAESLSMSGRYGRVTAPGAFKPVTNFPPFYSLTLAALDTLVGNMLQTSRVLNQILFGSLILLGGWAMYLATRSRLAALASSLLILTSDVLSHLSTWALSDSLFLGLLMFGLLSLFEFLRFPLRRTWLPVSALFFGLACLTRYAGVAFLLVPFTAVLLRSQPRGERFQDGAMVLSIGGLPLLAFLFRNWGVSGNPVNRPIPYFHPPSPEALELGARLIVRWFLPERILAALPAGAVVLLVSAFAALSIWIVVRWLAPRSPSPQQDVTQPEILAGLLAGSILAYAGFLLGSVVFLDVLIPISDRLLAPLHLLTLLLLVLGAHQGLFGSSHRRRAVILAGLALLAFLQAYRQVSLVTALRRDGQGYAARQWRESPVLDYLCQAPEEPIYANDLPAVYFHCGRMVAALPTARNAASGEADPDYPAAAEAMRRGIRESDGLIAFVGWYGGPRLERTGFADLVSGLTLRATFVDGLIYGQ